MNRVRPEIWSSPKRCTLVRGLLTGRPFFLLDRCSFETFPNKTARSCQSLPFRESFWPARRATSAATVIEYNLGSDGTTIAPNDSENVLKILPS